jgi:hypothetical protein
MCAVGLEPTISANEGPQTYSADRAASGTGFTHHIIIIIIIGATAQFEPRPSSEASASRPCSLQHSSSFFPPMSWLTHHIDTEYCDTPNNIPVLRECCVSHVGSTVFGMTGM